MASEVSSTIDLSGLTGATDQGGRQYYESGNITIASGGELSNTPSQIALSCDQLRFTGSNSSASFTGMQVDIRSTVDLNAFGIFANTGPPTSVNLILEDCAVTSQTRLIMGADTSHNLIMRRTNISCPGMALYGTGSILEDVVIRNMNTTQGLGIRTVFSQPPSGITIIDSGVGFNLRGTDDVQISGGSFINVTYEFLVQSSGTGQFTGDCFADDLSAAWVIFWRGSASGRIIRRNTLSFAYLDENNAALQGLRVYLEDAEGAEILNNETDVNGSIDSIKAERNIYTYGGSAESTATVDLPLIPYLRRERLYGYRFFEDPSYTFDDASLLSAKGIVNPYVVAADDATALATTNPTTANQAYDYCQSDDAQSANMQYPETLRTSDGATLSFPLDVVLDSSLGAISFSANRDRVSFSALSNGTFSTLQLSAGKTLILTQTGTYAASWRIPATSTVTLLAAGSYDLSSFAFAPGAIVQSTETVTVTVGVGQSGGITPNGAGVTVREPVLSIAFTGIPQVVNALVSVVDLTTDTPAYPTIANGTASIEVVAGRSYRCACDAPGYLRQAVTLNSATSAFEFDLVNWRSIYDAGADRSAEITFSYSTFAVVVSDAIAAGYSFADVFRTLEDYLSTQSGILFEFPPHPIVVDLGNGAFRYYLVFPYDTSLDQVNPVRISANGSNTGIPTLNNFVIILEGATKPLFDIFDFSNGKTINFQTDAVSAIVEVSGSGALTTDQANQLEELHAMLQTSGVLSAASLVNAPSSGGGGLTQAEVRSAVGLSSANLDAQLSSLVSSGANGTTTITTAIADLQTYGDDNWTTATGFIVPDDLPSNFSALLVDGSGQVTVGAIAASERTALATVIEAALLNDGDGQQLIDAIVSLINSNLALPSLELAAISNQVRAELAPELSRLDTTISSRLAGNSYTAPNDTPVLSAIAAIPTTPLLTNDPRLDNLDEPIGSRAEPSDVSVTVNGGFGNSDRDLLTTARDNSVTLAARWTEARATVLDLVAKLASRVGIGTSVTVDESDPANIHITTADDSLSQTMTKNADTGITTVSEDS